MATSAITHPDMRKKSSIAACPETSYQRGVDVILVIGEILFDEFPDYRRLGGAPFNFAYHLNQLGFDVRFISRIGIDDPGREILHKIELAGFNLDDIQIDERHPTGKVNVQLENNGEPQFDIVADVAYDYIEFIPEYHSGLVEDAVLVYFGSLIQRSEAGHRNLQNFISDDAPKALNFYDVNLRPGCYNNAVIGTSLSKTDILKLNSSELAELKQILSKKMNTEQFVRHLMETHSVGTVALTKGERGSELFTDSGRFNSEPADAIRMIDPVGAGDAYAAMLAAGILKKWPPEKILAQASLFAARICEIKGAIPDSAAFYEPFKVQFADN
jgi:fructokinase